MLVANSVILTTGFSKTSLRVPYKQQSAAARTGPERLCLAVDAGLDIALLGTIYGYNFKIKVIIE